MRSGGDPVFDPLNVEAHQFLVIYIGHRVEGPKLVEVSPIPRSLVVGGDNPVEGSVSASAERHPDDNMAGIVTA